MTLVDDVAISWRMPNLRGCEIFRGGFSDQKLPRHSHDGLMLSLIDEGAQKVRHRGIDHIGGSGQVIAVPPHGVHSCEAREVTGWRYRVLMVDTPVLASYLPGQGEGLACDTVVSDGQLASAMNCFFSECEHETTLALETRLSVVLRRFGERHAHAACVPVSRGREARAVTHAKAFLTGNLSANVSLRDLATAAALEPHRLVRAFTASVGLPPHAWHKQMRVRDAQTRLVRGETVADVAYATGFADQPHFTRTFRSLTGVTPACYRRANHQTESPCRRRPAFRTAVSEVVESLGCQCPTSMRYRV